MAFCNEALPKEDMSVRILSLKISALSAFIAAAAMLAPALAAENPMVGGAPMYASKNIVENAVNSKDHTTLVAAVTAAGLVETLQGAGPFTVFAPTNDCLLYTSPSPRD